MKKTRVASFSQTITLLTQDFNRYTESHGEPGFLTFLMKFFHNPGMAFSLVHRIQRYLLFHPTFLVRLIGKILYPLYFFYTFYILDYHIEPDVEIGGGLLLHNRSIVIANSTSIGKNVSIMGQVTIGTGFKPNHFDIRIGDNVQIGAGAKVIAKGKLSIVSNVVIGANAVVVKDIPRSGIYAGVPVRRLK